MNSLRARLSEPQFGSILGGLMFLWFALGLAFVAYRVNHGAARILTSTGVVFWPHDPATRFNWNFMYGNPEISLIAGCFAGIILGIWLRFDGRRHREEWIRDVVLAAKGVRLKKTLRGLLWPGVFIVAGVVPAWILSTLYQFSGAIYLNAAVAFTSFTHYSQIRRFRLQVDEALAMETMSHEEIQNVETWRRRERNSLKSMYRLLLLAGTIIALGAIFFTEHVDRVMARAEQTILDKQNDY